MSLMCRVMDAPVRSRAWYHPWMKCSCFLAFLYQGGEASVAGTSSSINFRQDIPSKSPGKIQDALRLTCQSIPEGRFLHSLISFMLPRAATPLIGGSGKT